MEDTTARWMSVTVAVGSVRYRDKPVLVYVICAAECEIFPFLCKPSMKELLEVDVWFHSPPL